MDHGEPRAVRADKLLGDVHVHGEGEAHERHVLPVPLPLGAQALPRRHARLHHVAAQPLGRGSPRRRAFLPTSSSPAAGGRRLGREPALAEEVGSRPGHGDLRPWPAAPPDMWSGVDGKHAQGSHAWAIDQIYLVDWRWRMLIFPGRVDK